MFKRVVWTGVGYGAGLASAYWVKRAARRRVERYVPDQVRQRAALVRREVGGAMREGRQVMRRYQTDAEAQIRADDPDDTVEVVATRPRLRSVGSARALRL